MSTFSVSVVAVALLQPSVDDHCAEPVRANDVQFCKYLDVIRNLEIESVDSVAMGTHEEMLALRSRARECGLMNRIDYVGKNISTFDVVNADPASKACLVKWIEKNSPALAFSEEKMEQLIKVQ